MASAGSSRVHDAIADASNIPEDLNSDFAGLSSDDEDDDDMIEPTSTISPKRSAPGSPQLSDVLRSVEKVRLQSHESIDALLKKNSELKSAYSKGSDVNFLFDGSHYESDKFNKTENQRSYATFDMKDATPSKAAKPSEHDSKETIFPTMDGVKADMSESWTSELRAEFKNLFVAGSAQKPFAGISYQDKDAGGNPNPVYFAWPEPLPVPPASVPSPTPSPAKPRAVTFRAMPVNPMVRYEGEESVKWSSEYDDVCQQETAAASAGRGSNTSAGKPSANAGKTSGEPTYFAYPEGNGTPAIPSPAATTTNPLVVYPGEESENWSSEYDTKMGSAPGVTGGDITQAGKPSKASEPEPSYFAYPIENAADVNLKLPARNSVCPDGQCWVRVDESTMRCEGGQHFLQLGRTTEHRNNFTWKLSDPSSIVKKSSSKKTSAPFAIDSPEDAVIVPASSKKPKSNMGSLEGAAALVAKEVNAVPKKVPKAAPPKKVFNKLGRKTQSKAVTPEVVEEPTVEVEDEVEDDADTVKSEPIYGQKNKPVVPLWIHGSAESIPKYLLGKFATSSIPDGVLSPPSSPAKAKIDAFVNNSSKTVLLPPYAIDIMELENSMEANELKLVGRALTGAEIARLVASTTLSPEAIGHMKKMASQSKSKDTSISPAAKAHMKKQKSLQHRKKAIGLETKPDKDKNNKNDGPNRAPKYANKYGKGKAGVATSSANKSAKENKRGVGNAVLFNQRYPTQSDKQSNRWQTEAKANFGEPKFKRVL